MDQSEAQATVHRFFDNTGATYDRVVALCTWGADRWWKRLMVDRIPGGSASVLDQACGTGILTTRIARRFPHCRVIGVDVEQEYLAFARKKALFFGLTNIELVAGRAEDVLLGTRFDCIISSYLAKYADLRALVGGIGTMLKEGGKLIMHDFTYPDTGGFAFLWRLNFVLLRTLGAWLYPEWRPAFDGLPGLLRQTPWVRELASLLKEDGFSEITVESLTFGAAAIVTARKMG